MNDVIKNLCERRSVKKYKPTPLPENILDEILKAGTFAPTGKNVQSPLIVAVTDPDTVRLLSSINAEVLGNENLDPFYGAPVAVVVFADSNMFTYVEDGSLVIGNMLNAAHSLGIGSCWIHRARQMFETERGRKLMQAWGISDNYKGIGNCILGYADENPVLKPRKENYIIKIK